MNIPQFTEEQRVEWRIKYESEADWEKYREMLENPLIKKHFPHLGRNHFLELGDCLCYVREYLLEHPQFDKDFDKQDISDLITALGQRAVFCMTDAIKRVFSDRVSLFLKGIRDPEPKVLAKQLNEKYIR